MSAEIVNLKQFRKAREKARKEQRAEENRLRFGRSRSEKSAEKQEDQLRQRHLDGARLEADGADDRDDAS